MLFLVAFLGGVLTIASPCILPVLPFVFTRAGQPFRRAGLPLLAGMAVTFAAVASLAAVAGSWVVRVNQYGRWLALAVVVLFGLALLLPRLAARLGAPVAALGSRLASARREGSPGSSLLLGAATGMLWAPCAGPILGLVLTGAAIRGASVETTLLLLAYASGAAVSLAVALLAGGRVSARLRRSPAAEYLRRGLGAAVAVGALAIAFGFDTGLLARWSTTSTTRMEEALFARLLSEDDQAGPDGAAMTAGPAMTEGRVAMEGGAAMMSANPAMMSSTTPAGLPVEGALPSLEGAATWLNSEPLTTDGLRGRVVLIDFWTYSCINCLRTMPYVKAWAEKYRDHGLVVVGVHSPEFAFERNVANVQRAVRNLGVTHPVALDNDFAIWRAFGNRYWPAHYLADAAGNIRYRHFGEGDYDVSERMIQQLLVEAGREDAAGATVASAGEGVALPSDALQVLSPETYLGYERAEHFASPGGQVPNESRAYAVPAALRLNEWALDGTWTVGSEQATLDAGPGRVVVRFHARDLHLVLARREGAAPVRFRVRLDGGAPGEDRGLDVDAAGNGEVREQRLYQLIRQAAGARERLLEVEFLEPGVTAYALTFG